MVPLISLLDRNTTQAQSSITWSDITILMESRSMRSRPTIAVDPWGQLHVIWTDRFYEENGATGQYEGPGDSLYYMKWDGEVWRNPIDILIQPTGSMYVDYPYLSIGLDGQIFLIWSGQNVLYFSQAPALTASSVRSWQPAQVIAYGDIIGRSHLVVGSDDQIHVVYGQSGINSGGNVFYTSSEDRGNEWSTPIALSSILPGEELVAAEPKIVLDDQGWLHVVWTERAPPNWIGHKIQYVRSEDGGETWTSPSPLGKLHPEEIWSENPSMAATGDGKLHLVWVCGDETHRCYRYSDDGGSTWSPREFILGDFVSRAGWDAMLADHESNLHLFTELRMPRGMYYASKKSDGKWGQPIRVVSNPDFNNGHYPQIASSGGNQLHVVWQKDALTGDILYMNITTLTSSNPHMTISNKNLLDGVPDPEEPILEYVLNENSTTSPEKLNLNETTINNQSLSPATYLFWGIIPVLFILATMIIVKIKRTAGYNL